MNSKAFTPVIATLLIVLVALTLLTIVSLTLTKIVNYSQQEIECKNFQLNSELIVKKICQLNQEEILVSLKVNPTQKINSIFFGFVNEKDAALFELKNNKRCLDIRTTKTEYGDECKILEQGEVDYIFQLDLGELFSEGFIEVNLENSNCLIERQEILPNC